MPRPAGERRVLELVGTLPAGKVYADVADVWLDLTGHKEQHRF